MRAAPAPGGSIEELIDKARGGCAECFGRILEGCRQYLLLIANQEFDSQFRAKLGASDLVQETFLEAHQDFSRFDGRTEDDLLAWLRQILLNNIRDAARQF